MLLQVRLHLCWGRYSSVDCSVNAIMRSRVGIPSTLSILFPFIVKFCTMFVLKKKENKQKEAGFGPFYDCSCASFATSNFPAAIATTAEKT